MTNFSLLEVLPEPHPLISIVDVGAMSDGANRFDRLLDLNAARVYGFEPQPEEFEKLKSREDAAHTYFNRFIGKGGPATFHTCEFAGCSSLYRPDPRVIDLFTGIGTVPTANFHVISTEEVETTRLDDVPELDSCDYLLIDVQGAELDVLSGATETLRETAVVEVEVEFIPLYEGQPLFADVEIFLRERGFLLHKLIDVSGRGLRPFAAGDRARPVSQFLWADAVFVRDFRRIDDLSPAKLLQTAIVLHEVYLSPDLAGLALAAYDKKGGTDLFEAYFDRISSSGNFEINFINVKDWE